GPSSPRRAVAVGLALTLAAPSGCAATFEPRPSPRIAVREDGWGGLKLVKNGRTIPLGFAGSGLAEAGQGNPQAEEHAGSYATETGVGIGLGVAGAVGVGVGTGIAVDQAARLDKISPVGFGLVAGGLALTIASAILQANARVHLWNAINVYNDALEPGFAYP